MARHGARTRDEASPVQPRYTLLSHHRAEDLCWVRVRVRVRVRARVRVRIRRVRVRARVGVRVRVRRKTCEKLWPRNLSSVWILDFTCKASGIDVRYGLCEMGQGWS